MIKQKRRGRQRREINFNLNDNIRVEKVRLIDDSGAQLGIVDTRKALFMAKDKDLDLYVISEKAEPPVAKIIDYGKYKYEMQKKTKESKKHQTVIKIKEIRLSTFIEAHDIEVKVKRAIEFLTEGYSIKVSLRFKGREMGYQERGRANIEKFKEMISEYAKEKGEAKLEGRFLHANFEPHKPSDKKKREQEREKENGENSNKSDSNKDNTNNNINKNVELNKEKKEETAIKNESEISSDTNKEA